MNTEAPTQPRTPTYLALQVSPAGALEETRRPLVEPAAGSVRIRVEACGVCHTDAGTVQPHADDVPGLVPGHEVVGLIDALGDGVDSWTIGQRVGVGYLGGQCGVCRSCRRGDFVHCSDQPRTGSTVDGGYAEYLYARETGLVAIPDALTAVEAAPLLCAGLTVYNALLVAAPIPGDRVAVQGIGGLGHLGLQYARAMGMHVTAVARGAAKEEFARTLGAHDYVDSTAVDVAAALKSAGGSDVVLSTASAGGVTTELVKGLAVGGTLVVLSSGGDPIRVDASDLVRSGVRLTGSLTGSSFDNERNLAFAADQGIEAMIEERPLSEAQAAFDRMLSGDARFRMVLAV